MDPKILNSLRVDTKAGHFGMLSQDVPAVQNGNLDPSEIPQQEQVNLPMLQVVEDSVTEGQLEELEFNHTQY